MHEAPVYLLAAGGHGSVVLDALLEMGVPVAGILDPAKRPGDSVFGVPVLGGDEWLADRDPRSARLANGAGAVPWQELRGRLFDRFHARGFGFVSVRHPSAVIGRDVDLEEGSQVMAGCVLQCRVRVGRNAVINTRVSVDHDCQVGAHVFVGPGATLCGEVSVGDHTFVGSGAVLLPGVKVGNHAVIGAGAVVTRAVPDGALVTGVPAAGRKAKA
jgi:sugar O-acyltransferase (sialic acid O-acetyltransferase NeuD family)